ncbi:MAG: sigma-70 family RNA polymerase sigma factor [Planctomycetota bacterium]|nr:sigma-70 family RNA polymerase sigma factor [Planctomycetota bacterium]
MQSEPELLKSSLAGNREAFGVIVKGYQSLICAITYSSTGSLSKSEELAQETFLIAWRKLGQLKDLNKFRAWLCTIARNVVGQSIKREQRDIIHNAQSIENLKTIGAAKPQPCDLAISKEQEAIIWQALRDIPEQFREPMVLFYREHQSAKTVAQFLGISEDAAKQRLSRGRRILKENVAALVEEKLERTTPGKVFTIAVIAALPGIIPQAANAAIAGIAAKSSIAVKSAVFANWLGILGPLVGLIGMLLGIRASLKNAASPREWKFINWTAFIQITYCFVLAAVTIPFVLWWRLWRHHSSWLILLIYVLFLLPLIPFTIWANRREKQIQIEDGTYIEPQYRMLRMTSREIYAAFAGAVFGSLLWLYRVAVEAQDWIVLCVTIAAGFLIFSLAVKVTLRAKEHGFKIAIGTFIAVGLLQLAIVNLRWDRWVYILKAKNITLWQINFIIIAFVVLLALIALFFDFQHRRNSKKND